MHFGCPLGFFPASSSFNGSAHDHALCGRTDLLCIGHCVDIYLVELHVMCGCAVQSSSWCVPNASSTGGWLALFPVVCVICSAGPSRADVRRLALKGSRPCLRVCAIHCACIPVASLCAYKLSTSKYLHGTALLCRAGTVCCGRMRDGPRVWYRCLSLRGDAWACMVTRGHEGLRGPLCRTRRCVPSVGPWSVGYSEDGTETWARLGLTANGCEQMLATPSKLSVRVFV